MISKERLKFAIKLSITFVFLIIAVAIIPKIFSRYQSTATSNPNIDVAFFIIKPEFQTESIILDELVPSPDPYLVNFTISNNDGTNRLGVDAKYTLSIKTTTNLPLTYALYENETYQDTNPTNIVLDNTVVTQDDDGTYFITMTAEEEYFGFQNNQENSYQLVIYFPTTYISYEYQDLVEGIEISINSEQIVNNS